MLRVLLAIAALALCLMQVACGRSPESSGGTVTIVVPFSPAGNIDVFARHLATRLQDRWGRPVVVENRPGAGSMVGMAHVAQAKPDGNTLLLTTSAFVMAPAVYENLPFDPKTDLTPVGLTGSVSYLILSNANSGWNTLDDFIRAARAGNMFVATAGLGTTTHFAAEKLMSVLGLDLKLVHYKGGGDALISLVSGESSVYTSSVATSLDYIRSGKVTALAVMGNERVKAFPDVPSTRELGYPDLEVDQWIGAFAPGGTPREVLERLNADITSVVSSEEFREVVRPLDVTIRTNSVGQFASQIDGELVLWKSLAKERGIRAE